MLKGIQMAEDEKSPTNGALHPGEPAREKPAEPKPEEPKTDAPPEQKPAEGKAESKPEEKKADEKKPDEAKPAEPAKAPEKPQILCRKKARKIIHRFAIAGTVFAALPIPAGTSAGLAALETYLVYFVGKVYGEELSYAETLMVASGLNVAGVALKTLAREGLGLIPVLGSGIRAGIAAGAIEAIGEGAIRHFEKKHPGKTTNAE
jgi:uncharacterized protein (DUF697 family)